MLSFAGKEREIYRGMTHEEISSELQLDGIEAKVEKLEAITADAELDAVQLEDQVFDAKIKSKYQELKSKYGEKLTRNQFMKLSGYGKVKADDYIAAHGSYNTLTVAKTLINDSEYQKVFDESSSKLLDYLKKKYKMYDNTMPVEFIGDETLSTQADAVREAKKLMGIDPRTKLEFVPLEIICAMVMEHAI